MTRTVSGKEIKFRYALKREMPFHKVKKVIRFRFAEIERWIDKKNKKGGSLLNRFAV
jgi:hypothetical protein